MFSEIDLRALAERSGPERAFLSLYLSGADAWGSLNSRVRTIRSLLADNEAELQHFEENLTLVQAFLEGYAFQAEALCVFACWAADYRQAFPLEKKVPDLLWVDSSPYIRPLAELQDEYERFVVVTADNTEAHVHLVTSTVPEDEVRVKGDVKNRVKVGGWSQKRYQRRRDKELQQYAREVAGALTDLNEREAFSRIVLLGTDETLLEIQRALPEAVAAKVVGREGVDLHRDDQVWARAFTMVQEQERASEASLWEAIKGEYLRGGRAVVGAEAVLQAAALGRVQRMIVTRDARLPGTRCRACDNLHAGTPSACPACASDDLFPVDLVNELVELLATTGAEAEFADPLAGLADVGDVAALLRY